MAWGSNLNLEHRVARELLGHHSSYIWKMLESDTDHPFPKSSCGEVIYLQCRM